MIMLYHHPLSQIQLNGKVQKHLQILYRSDMWNDRDFGPMKSILVSRDLLKNIDASFSSVFRSSQSMRLNSQIGQFKVPWISNFVLKSLSKF